MFVFALELIAGPAGLRADSLPLDSGGRKFWDSNPIIVFRYLADNFKVLLLKLKE